MASLSRSVTFGSLATLALGACVAATAVPASAQDGQSIARSWGQGGQGMSHDGQRPRSWGQGGLGMSQDGQRPRSWGQGGLGMAGSSWGQGGQGRRTRDGTRLLAESANLR